MPKASTTFAFGFPDDLVVPIATRTTVIPTNNKESEGDKEADTILADEEITTIGPSVIDNMEISMVHVLSLEF